MVYSAPVFSTLGHLLLTLKKEKDNASYSTILSQSTINNQALWTDRESPIHLFRHETLILNNLRWLCKI